MSVGITGELIVRPTTRESGGVRRLESALAIGSASHTVWFDVPAKTPPTPTPGDAFLTAALLPAMGAVERLVIDAPVSAALLDRIRRAQVFVNAWFPEFRVLPIEATAVADAGSPAEGVGLMFSGGLDSFYTLHEERDRLTHLVFVHGFDIALDKPDLHAAVLARIREVGRGVGIPLVEATTNVRTVSDHYAHWADHYHGWASAAMAHALNGTIGRCYLAAGRTHANHAPMGVHPILPPMWASERMQFVHHGLATTREGKARVLGEWPIAMEHLRVCWRNTDNAYNCGRCGKCTRTKVNLLIAGVLDRCLTLDDHIDYDTLATMDFESATDYELRKDTYRDAVAADLSPDLLARLYAPIREFEMSEALRRASIDLHLLGARRLADAAVDDNRESVYRALSAYEGSWLFRRLARGAPYRLLRGLGRRIRGLVNR